jgi:hypothetical protein
MLPSWKSYLISDNSQLWRIQAAIFSGLPLRHEHQLFPGSAVLIWILVGAIGRFQTENRRLAWLNLSAAILFIIITLDINRFSLYWFIWRLPGMNSIRAVTRGMLVVMWPLALFMAWSIDGFMQWSKQHSRWWQFVTCFLVGLLLAESIFYNHTTFSKAEALTRLEDLRKLIPTQIPSNPILFVAANPQKPYGEQEVDSMLLAQEDGWATLNGYTGNNPTGYQSAESCAQLPARIKNYMDSVSSEDPNLYLNFMKRVITLNFMDCDPSWWERMP